MAVTSPLQPIVIMVSRLFLAVAGLAAVGYASPAKTTYMAAPTATLPGHCTTTSGLAVSTHSCYSYTTRVTPSRCFRAVPGGPGGAAKSVEWRLTHAHSRGLPEGRVPSADGAHFLPGYHRRVDRHGAVLHRLLPDYGHHHRHDAVSDAVREMPYSNKLQH